MEHFEELWEEAGGGICGKQSCEKYYRKALNWCLTWLDNDSPCGCDRVSTELIKRELED